jgi:YVTN family beta-propeller protein
MHTNVPQGLLTPLNCHIRLANPRTPQTAATSAILRRSYQYDRSPDVDGNPDTGHAFCCFQQALQTYNAMQARLENETLVAYILLTLESGPALAASAAPDSGSGVRHRPGSGQPQRHRHRQQEGLVHRLLGCRRHRPVHRGGHRPRRLRHDRGANTLSVIDPHTLTVVTTVATGNSLHGVAS